MANSSGRGETGTVVWAVAAIVVVGVFVWWLSITAEPSVTPLLVAPDDTTETTEAATAVSAAEFEPNTAAWYGRVVELTDVPVVQHMGSTMFWIELPSGNPFLVRASAQVAANGLPAPQSRVNVVGTVRQKNPQVLDAWLQEGVLTSRDQRTQAEYGDSYIEATAIRPAG